MLKRAVAVVVVVIVVAVAVAIVVAAVDVEEGWSDAVGEKEGGGASSR